LIISRHRHWLRVGAVVALLFGTSWATHSKQEAVSAAAGQAVDVSKVEWKGFLPPGEGQFQTSLYCSNCHTLQQVVENRSDEAGWTTIVQTMVFAHGAPIQEDDMAAITKYLAHSFTPSTPKLQLPIHINSAPKETLALLGSLSGDDVQKIIDARAKEKLRDYAALESVVQNKNLAQYKSVLVFD
jgi:hypothetical protein